MKEYDESIVSKNLSVIEEVDEELYEEQQENIQVNHEEQIGGMNEIPAQSKEQEQRRRQQGHELRERLRNNYVMSGNLFSETMIPMDAELKSEYRDEYQEKKLSKSRESKIKNKKSRLYVKDQVAKRFEAVEAEEFTKRDERAKLRRKLKGPQREELKCEELSCLSVLATDLTSNDVRYDKKFDELVRRYTGVDKEGNKADEAEIEKGRFSVIADIANILMLQDDTRNINLFDDRQLAAASGRLDRISRLLKAFKSLLKQNPGFMEALNAKENEEDRTAEKLQKQIDRLTAIDDVYRVRKLIVTNPYYRTHYNDELSMNAGANDLPQKKYLSKLLRTQYYLGRNLQQVMGNSADVEFPSAKLADGTAYMKKFEEEVRGISMDAEDEYGDSIYDRKNVDNMLIFLEHEKECMPPDNMLFTIDEVMEKKPKSVAHIMASNPGYDSSENVKYIRKLVPNPTPEQKRRNDRIVSAIFDGFSRAPQIEVKSKRLHNHVGGDTLARQVKILDGPFAKTLTDEELVEMIENLSASARIKEPTEKQQAMIEDKYLYSYTLYTNLMHQNMKKTFNILGDKFEILQPEDWARLMGDLEMGDLMIGAIASSSNMDTHLPYEFLKKYGDQPVEHLKDFDLLSKGISSLAFMSDVYRKGVLDVYQQTESFSDFHTKLIKKRDDASKKYDELNEDENATEKEIEAAKKNLEKAEGEVMSQVEVYVMNKYNSIDTFLRLSDLDKKSKAYVWDQIKFRHNATHPDGLVSGYLSFKNSKYWDFSTTPEAEKKAYWQKCKNKGYVDVKMELKDYDEKYLKEFLRGAIKVALNLDKTAGELGLGKSETSREDMELLRGVWGQLGFSEDEFYNEVEKIKQKSSSAVAKHK